MLATVLTVWHVLSILEGMTLALLIARVCQGPSRVRVWPAALLFLSMAATAGIFRSFVNKDVQSLKAGG